MDTLRLLRKDPELYIDLYWLSRQRRTLGADAFRVIVAEHCDNESMTTVLALLDAFDRGQAQTGAEAAGSSKA